MSDFPERLDEREAYIFDRVIAGDFEASWVRLEWTDGPDTVGVSVMEDALKVHGVRVNVSATAAQRLADVLDASLMTATVADAVFAGAARRVEPAPMPISSSVAAMVKHSQTIDDRLARVGGAGLASTVGKHWILDKKLSSARGRACNYGWHFVGGSFRGISGFAPAGGRSRPGEVVKVIQPNATAHDARHSDYSQTCQLVAQACWVNGEEKRFSEVLTDPVLSRLLSNQGPFDFVRQPGVPEVRGKLVLLPTVISTG